MSVKPVVGKQTEGLGKENMAHRGCARLVPLETPSEYFVVLDYLAGHAGRRGRIIEELSVYTRIILLWLGLVN